MKAGSIIRLKDGSDWEVKDIQQMQMTIKNLNSSEIQSIAINDENVNDQYIVIKELIRRGMHSEVNYFSKTIDYRIFDMFDIYYDGYYDIEFETVDEFTYTFAMIDREGGVGEVVKEIHLTYGITEQ